MLTATGKVSVEPHKGRIVLNILDDFVAFYYWLISKHYWIRMNRPMHGAHITIANTKFHSNINWKKAVWYDKKDMEFQYNPYIIEGGFRKGFLMYYLRVFSPEMEQMKTKIGINDNENYRGLHVTICNGKSNSVFPDWPSMIEIKK